MTGRADGSAKRAGDRSPGAASSRPGWRLLPAALMLLAVAPAAAAQEGTLTEGTTTRVGGGIYLYHYAPVDLAGADDHTEIYAAFVDVDHRTGPWTFHAEARWRDTKLREFYPSTIWIQEGWAAYRTPLESSADLSVRAGKLYTRLGRFWDGSFFGNLHYFDGLKLDPDFGVETVLDVPAGAARVEARAQYLLNDDRINGALEGRDLEGVSSGDESGSPVGSIHVAVPILGAPDGASGEAAHRLTVRAGLSGMVERGSVGVDGGGGPDQTPADVRLEHLAADAQVTAWGHTAYVEYTDRTAEGATASTAAGPAGSDADYWLAGVQLHVGPFHFRYNYSRADYGDAGFHERIHQPGMTVDLRSWLHAIVEYDDWVREAGPSEPVRMDRSLNFVILSDI